MLPVGNSNASAVTRCHRQRQTYYLDVIAVILACVLFVINVSFSFGAFGHRLGPFVPISDSFYLNQYRLEVIPADWVFQLTPVIDLWQAAWLTYGISTLFRRRRSMQYFQLPPLMPPILYVVFAFSMACKINWLLIWERQYMEIALVFVNLMSFTSFVCLAISMRRLDVYFNDVIESHATMALLRHLLQASNQNGEQDIEFEFPDSIESVAPEGANIGPFIKSLANDATFRYSHNADVWLVRLLVQNGLAMFATWAVVASMFTFAVVLCYRSDGSRQDIAGTVALGMFAIEIVVWWTFENLVYERHTRYLATPYAVLLVSLAGILCNNADGDGEFKSTNERLVAALFVLVALLAAIKMTLFAWRRFIRPRFNRQNFHQDHCRGIDYAGIRDPARQRMESSPSRFEGRSNLGRDRQVDSAGARRNRSDVHLNYIEMMSVQSAATTWQRLVNDDNFRGGSAPGWSQNTSAQPNS